MATHLEHDLELLGCWGEMRWKWQDVLRSQGNWSRGDKYIHNVAKSTVFRFAFLMILFFWHITPLRSSIQEWIHRNCHAIGRCCLSVFRKLMQPWWARQWRLESTLHHNMLEVSSCGHKSSPWPWLLSHKRYLFFVGHFLSLEENCRLWQKCARLSVCFYLGSRTLVLKLSRVYGLEIQRGRLAEQPLYFEPQFQNRYDTWTITTPAHQHKVALGTALRQHMLAWCLWVRQQTVEGE